MLRHGNMSIYVVILLAGIWFQYGCATQRRIIRAPEEPVPPLVSTEDALKLLRRNYGSIDFLKAGGTIETKFSAEDRRRKASFVLMLKRPDKLRIRTYRPLVPLLLELVYDGQRCWLYAPSRHTAYMSRDCNVFYFDDGALTLPANVLIAAVVVVSDFDALYSMPAELNHKDEYRVLTLTGGTEPHRELWIDPKTGVVDRQMVFNRKGEKEVVVEYSEKESTGNAIVPRRIEITLPQAETSITLILNDIKTDVRMPPAAFEFLPPRGTSILQVERNIDAFSALIGEE
jgi:outer membrane lipoprotein-sorting protein